MRFFKGFYLPRKTSQMVTSSLVYASAKVPLPYLRRKGSSRSWVVQVSLCAARSMRM